jgi:hypothetical protein
VQIRPRQRFLGDNCEACTMTQLLNELRRVGHNIAGQIRFA